MSHVVARLLAGIAFAASVACAPVAGVGGAGGTAPVRGDSKTVTENELAVATQLNLYDYVAAERPRWLATSRKLPLVIFVDDTRLGDAATLRTLTTGSVRMLRFFEASAAQQKFNGRDIGTVIQVITK
ncbi:MAG TPA: hypothetical protein VFI52_03410 [Gemmatimonadaceae bacterium]|nr:hypothetical protein [Gemmatimonadaceae bacterium]